MRKKAEKGPLELIHIYASMVKARDVKNLRDLKELKKREVKLSRTLN